MKQTPKKMRDLPRLVVSSRHLTPEDADLLASSGWESITKVTDFTDGFTVSMVGVWGGVRDAGFEDVLAKLSELGHSDGFLEMMRFARLESAWSFRFDDEVEVHPNFPVGGYEPTPGMKR